MRHSPALLGWYVCDDCDTVERFPPACLAKVYTALKAWDADHVTFGADWSTPWSNYDWGESVPTGLGFDVPQVENYKVGPSLSNRYAPP